MNPNITIEIIEKYIDKIYFEYLSHNHFIYENKQMKKRKNHIGY